MKGLKIHFRAGGAVFSEVEYVEGFAAVVQDSLVNIATSKGSDAIFPDRGTDILSDALQGRIVSEQSAQHSANFAAIDTLFFVRAQDAVTDTARLSALLLQLSNFNGQQLDLDAKFTADDGTVIGTTTTL